MNAKGIANLDMADTYSKLESLVCYWTFQDRFSKETKQCVYLLARANGGGNGVANMNFSPDKLKVIIWRLFGIQFDNETL